MRDRNMPIRIVKMQIWKKIFYAVFISLLCFLINKGDPKRATLLKNIQITDEKLQYIFQTTIAVQTKKIRQRITQENDGIWRLLENYVNTARWVDIEVQLKSRIGIRLNSIFYDKLNNNIHIDFGQPDVLDRSYTTKILSSSDNFFSKWSIKQFQAHKDQFLSELIDHESNSLISLFKQDSNKMSQLQGEYYNKILSTLNNNYNQLAPEVLIWKLNQYVISLLGNIVESKMLQSINSSYFYNKQIAPIASKLPDNDKGNQVNKREQHKNQKQQRKKESYKKYSYTQEQRRKRQRIKNKLEF